MKLIFENWNKWLNEQEAPQTDESINKIRRALIRYFGIDQVGGGTWIEFLRKNNDAFNNLKKATEVYKNQVQPRINEIIDGVIIKVAYRPPTGIGLSASEDPPFGVVTMSPKEANNKYDLYRVFFEKIDEFVQNTDWCKKHKCYKMSEDVFTPVIKKAFSAGEIPLKKEKVPAIYSDLHILRLRTSFDFPVERKQAKEFLNQIRRYGNKRNNIWYAPNIWEALRQMKKLHRSDEYIVNALNKIASNLPSKDTRDIA
jgi:hypothetical protein